MNREIKLLTAVYLLAHFPLLLTTGVFLDTWVLLHGIPYLNILTFSASSRPPVGYYLNLLLSIDGIFALRLSIFAAYLASGLFFRNSLTAFEELTPSARIFITAVFMTIPVDVGRVSGIRAYAATCYALFYLGMWLVFLHISTGKFHYRFLALVSLFMSFWLNSTLSFYAVIGCYILYFERKRLWPVSSIVKVFLRYLDFWILPFFFWFINRKIFPAYGQYANYNALNLQKINWNVLEQTFNGSFVQVFENTFFHPSASFYIIVSIIAIALLYCMRNLSYGPQINLLKSGTLIAIGVIFTILAVFPYVTVGKIPDQHDWNSRLNQLIPLGISLIIYFGTIAMKRVFFFNWRMTSFLLLLMISSMIATNYCNYMEYWRDWYKHCGMATQFKTNDCIRSNTSFLIRDLYKSFNARNRKIRHFEYAGLMKMAFGDEKRFVYDESEWLYIEKSNLREWFFNETLASIRGEKYSFSVPDHSKQYFLSEWSPKYPDTLIVVFPKKEQVGYAELWRLKYQEIFKPKLFNENVKNWLAIECSPINSIPQ